MTSTEVAASLLKIVTMELQLTNREAIEITNEMSTQTDDIKSSIKAFTHKAHDENCSLTVEQLSFYAFFVGITVGHTICGPDEKHKEPENFMNVSVGLN